MMLCYATKKSDERRVAGDEQQRDRCASLITHFPKETLWEPQASN
jgi:hypothetical protein